MTLKYDYRKILFYLQNTGEESLGENVNELRLFPNALQKFLIPYLVVLGCNYNPNIRGYYAIMGTVSCCSRTAGIITRTIY